MNDQEYYSEFEPTQECEEELIATEENLQKYDRFSWWMSGVMVLIVCCYGAVSNAIAAQMLTCRPSLTTSRITKTFLLFQVLFDSVYLVCNLFESIELLQASDPKANFDAALLYKFKSIAFYCSIGIRVLLIREKYISTRPEATLPQSDAKNFWANPTVRLFLLIICCLIISIPLAYEMKEVNIENPFNVHLNTSLNEKGYSYDDDQFIDKFNEDLTEETNTLQEPMIASSLKASTKTLTIMVPTDLRFSYHYLIWYKIIIVACLPGIFLVSYCRKTYVALKIQVEINNKCDEFCLNSLTTESYVNRVDLKHFGETIGVIVMNLVFVVINIPKLILLIYELINIKWIEENFTLCLIPHTLFYGKTITDLIVIVNASVSIYIYFFCRYKCNIIHSWSIKGN